MVDWGLLLLVGGACGLVDLVVGLRFSPHRALPPPPPLNSDAPLNVGYTWVYSDGRIEHRVDHV